MNVPLETVTSSDGPACFPTPGTPVATPLHRESVAQVPLIRHAQPCHVGIHAASATTVAAANRSGTVEDDAPAGDIEAVESTMRPRVGIPLE